MTRVELYNQALAHIGADAISSETQKDRNGRECRRHYKTSCRNILEQFEWSCAMTRLSLTAVEETEEEYNADLYPFAYQYALPEDCIRLIDLNGSRDMRRLVERRYIYTDAEELVLSYIADVSEPDAASDELPFPDTLCDAIARFMAYRMAPYVSPKMNANALYAEYRQSLTVAMDTDAMEHYEDEEATGFMV